MDKLNLPGSTVKKALSAHSVIGLTTAALMYLICLTGTLAVLAENFEQWEQPVVAEFSAANLSGYAFALSNSALIENAIVAFQRKVSRPPDSLYVVLPTPALPRMHVADDATEYWLNSDGTLGPAVADGWTHMLRELHINLHLPQTLGLILVSAIGATLVALIISGLLAHPRVFRDAFTLRLGGERRLEQADIHNRLSVWGLPFYLMISITGAFFGLVGILIYIAAPVFYDNDRDALLADVYGADPVIDTAPQPLDIAAVFAAMATAAPAATPIYLVVQQIGTRQQMIEVAATLPGRLSYSEIYRFSSTGEFLGNQGLTDGPVSRQIVYSVYRLHFGNYGGTLVRILYVLLGFALSVISVSGVNVWLARRGGSTHINAIWSGVVWGLPLALIVAAICSVLFEQPPFGYFAVMLVAAICGSVGLARRVNMDHCLRLACAIALLLLVGGHVIKFGFLTSQSITILNLALLLLAVMVGVRPIKIGV